jgi:hypothetical protein
VFGDRENRLSIDDTSRIEQQTLRLIISSSLSQEDLNRALQRLAAYMWLEPEHQTVFQAIRRAGKRTNARLRDELPAQATRMGFPDVDWPRYFWIEGNVTAHLDELVGQLLARGAQKP